jgi:CRISPR-associated protein, Cas5t family
MSVLRVKLYQEFACYRKPMTYGFWETYPLPPLSTVKGFFHNVVEAKEYIPARYGIQGKFKSVVLDLQIMNKFDRKDSKNKGIYIEEYDKKLIKSPIYVSNLYAVELTIYIESKLEEYLKKFRENLSNLEYPSLGRKEDLVRVDSADIVELIERDLVEDSYYIKDGIYLSKEKAKELEVNGINYRMNFYYESKNGIRFFKKKDVVYVDNKTLEFGSILYDKEEDKVVDLIGD